MADWIGVDVANATRFCSIDGCERPHNAHGWCLVHYKRFRKYGDPLGSAPTRDVLCSIDGCGRERRARGWCAMHYQRWQDHGDPLYAAPVRSCTVEGCVSRNFGRGWCSMHYARWKRYGSATFRVAGEVVDGCRVCPGCKVDKPLDGYSASTGRCKACVADQRRVSRLSLESVPLPEIHCIMCSTRFVPRSTKGNCCSESCSRARKSQIDRYYSRVDGNKQSKQRWQAENPESRVNTAARRRARKVGSQVASFGKAEIAARMAYFGNRCWMCRGPFECIDHVKPLAQGGPHILANLRPACSYCNGSKSSKWEGVKGVIALAA